MSDTSPPASEHSPIVAHLRRHYGDDLQGVLVYDEGDYDLRYRREDIAAEYDAAAIRDVTDDAVLESLATVRHESLFDFGSPRYVVRGFDDAAVVQLFADDLRGIVFSVDGSATRAIEDLLSSWPETREPDPR